MADAEVVAGQSLGLVPGDGIAVIDPRLVVVAAAGHISESIVGPE
jgi:hypothetical protein